MPQPRRVNSARISSQEIRESLCIYPDAKFNILRFILESITLSLEVFLHGRIGESYITVPKAVAASAFLFLTVFLAIFGFTISIHPDPTQIGGVSVLKSVVESLVAFEWHEAKDNFYSLISALRDKERRPDILDPIQLAVVFFSVAVNYHLITTFVAKHRNPPRYWHPRSSGEPWPIWNSVYRLGHFYNVRSDLVKQICEPLFCFLLGGFLNNRFLTNSLMGFSLPPEWQFLPTWLRVGAFALIVRAYLENRTKKKLTLDRLANECDAQAFELQDQLYAKEANTAEFVEAVGRKGS